jgi:hypothetical protein
MNIISLNVEGAQVIWGGSPLITYHRTPTLSATLPCRILRVDLEHAGSIYAYLPDADGNVRADWSTFEGYDNVIVRVYYAHGYCLVLRMIR